MRSTAPRPTADSSPIPPRASRADARRVKGTSTTRRTPARAHGRLAPPRIPIVARRMSARCVTWDPRGRAPAMCMRLIGIGSQFLMQEEFAAIKAKALA